MMSVFSNISPLSERAILIEFDGEIKESTLEKLLFFKNKLEKFLFKEEVEVINTYTSLLVFYPTGIENLYNEVLRIKAALKHPNIEKNINKKIFHVPVCYDPFYGWDLDVLADTKNLSKEQIVELHTSSLYTVYFIGFLPGFLYLGGLNEKLSFSRRNEPRMEVLKGAVGIGEKQTGIYPKKSPGGWHIIGNCPVDFFDKNLDPPCVISPGDHLQFYSVTKEEYTEISAKIEEGNFHLKFQHHDS